MKKEDLYGALSLELDAGRAVVEAATRLMFLPHESSYRGGNYYRLRTSDAVELVLQVNFIEDDGEATEAKFPHEHLLLYVDGHEAAVGQIAKRLEHDAQVFRLLRSRTF